MAGNPKGYTANSTKHQTSEQINFGWWKTQNLMLF